ncbi:WhiB family transcriptional regulator [Saccharopolyspora gregorii]|uniref:WhiB family transcriptional regulator n=1 Tax=Saccharopolyspora gregorii TaxID=33914 RepID=A0ABP6RKL5_9PSEU
MARFFYWIMRGHGSRRGGEGIHRWEVVVAMADTRRLQARTRNLGLADQGFVSRDGQRVLLPSDGERGPARGGVSRRRKRCASTAPVLDQCAGTRWPCRSPTGSGVGLSESEREVIIKTRKRRVAALAG